MQLCGFPSLDLVQEGQLIGRQKWTHWDAERPRELPVGGDYAFTVSGSGSETSDTESTEGNIDSESEYDLESLMDTDSDVDTFEQELRSQILTPRGMLISPVNLPDVHVHDNYRPATPIYSPTSLIIPLA